MNLVVNHSALLLDRRDTIELIDAAGATAALDSGCLWITMDGDRRDIVLRAGDSWTVERNGRTLMHAEAASKLRLTSPPKRRAASAMDRILSALSDAFTRLGARRRIVPYY